MKTKGSNSKDIEIAAKKQKIDEPGLQIQDIPFAEDCELAEDREQQYSEEATQTEEFEYLFSSAPEKPFHENWFKGDDEKVTCYSGLPGFDVFHYIFFSCCSKVYDFD